MPDRPRKPAPRGGAREGAGRPAPSGRGRTVSVYLTPAEASACLRHGPTVQEGIRALIAADGRR